MIQPRQVQRSSERLRSEAEREPHRSEQRDQVEAAGLHERHNATAATRRGGSGDRDKHQSSQQELIDVRNAHREQPEVKHEAAVEQRGPGDQEMDRGDGKDDPREPGHGSSVEVCVATPRCNADKGKDHSDETRKQIAFRLRKDARDRAPHDLLAHRGHI